MSSLNELCKELLSAFDPYTNLDKIYVAGVSDYTRAEIRACDFDLLIRDGKIYMMPPKSAVHTISSNEVRYELEEKLSSVATGISDGYSLNVYMNGGLKDFPDIFGCNTAYMAGPDAHVCLKCNRTGGILDMIMVVEVKFRNGNFLDLITKGAAFLTRWTNVLYALLIDLHEECVDGVRKVNTIRVMLFKRSGPKSTRMSPSEPVCMEVPPFLASKAHRATSQEIQNALNVEVVFDQIISRADTENPNYHCIPPLSGDAIIQHTGIPDLIPRCDIQIDMKRLAHKIFQFVDLQLHDGTYPECLAFTNPTMPRR